MRALPTHAEIVIIGGGIVGCSTAYHLAGLGKKDAVLLERHNLTSGSTWHAAGLVGQRRTSANITQLLKYSVELYNALEVATERVRCSMHLRPPYDPGNLRVKA